MTINLKLKAAAEEAVTTAAEAMAGYDTSGHGNVVDVSSSHNYGIDDSDCNDNSDSGQRGQQQ